jgi:hypothetical protein
VSAQVLSLVAFRLRVDFREIGMPRCYGNRKCEATTDIFPYPARAQWHILSIFLNVLSCKRPPLWSEFLTTDPEARVLFPALPDFLGEKKGGGEQVVGQKRGPLSLVSTTEELLDRKVAAPV